MASPYRVRIGRMGQECFDIAVVGAGPAGSVTAYAAAKRGFRVALIDRSSFPRDKTCGDGVGPAAVEVMRRLGLGEIFADDLPVENVTIFGPHEEPLRSAISRSGGRAAYGHVIPRLDLDNRLVREALRAGAADFTGKRYRSTNVGAHSREVRLSGPGGCDQTINARLVVGADGAHSQVRRDLPGTQAHQSEKHGFLAIRAYADSEDFRQGGEIGPRLLFKFDRNLLPNYAWVFPLENGKVNLGVGGPLATMRNRGDDLKALMMKFIDEMRARGVDLGDIREQRAHHIPHVGGLPKLAHPRAVLLGDAASMSNPVSGEGIAYAVSAAERLVNALPPNLGDEATLEATLTGFETDFRRIHRAHFASCLLALRTLRSQRWATALLRAARRDRRMLGDGVELMFGFGRIRASTVLRILRSGWPSDPVRPAETNQA